MAEQSLQEKQFDLLYDELRSIASQLEMLQRRLEVLEALPPAVLELSRLSRSIESLAYAALGREGPRVRRGRA
jgi:prefoldin subunit 5